MSSLTSATRPISVPRETVAAIRRDNSVKFDLEVAIVEYRVPQELRGYCHKTLVNRNSNHNLISFYRREGRRCGY